MTRFLLLALAGLVAAAAATPDMCPSCDRITNQTACQTGKHPTLVGPHGHGCDGHPQPGSVYCAWNATIGNVTTPGCSNCTMAQGVEMAKAFCQHTCRYTPTDVVVMQGYSSKNNKIIGPQWTCYNPDSVQFNHTSNQTEWKPGSSHYCRDNHEIETIHSTCTCTGVGGCPPYVL